MNLSNTSGDDLSAGINDAYGTSLSKKSHVGFGGGVFVTFNLQPTFAIQPELLFNQKGIKIDGPEGSGDVVVNHVEVPILAKYLPPTTGSTKFGIFAGPTIGFKAGSSVSATAADPANAAVAAGIKSGLETLADQYLKTTDLTPGLRHRGPAAPPLDRRARTRTDKFTDKNETRACKCLQTRV